MHLTPEQRLKVNNIIASNEMDCGPLSEETKRTIELIVAGELDGETVIADFTKRIRERSQG